MQGKSRTELYKQFLDFITHDVQNERQKENRRLLNVFVWSFILPAVTSALLILLVKTGVLPRAARNYLDWAILIFPVSFALYLLSSEVLTQIPATIKRGGIATELSQATKEGFWREKVCDGMIRSIGSDPADWVWLIASFRIDLQKIHNRTRYLTALAGAVFYLLLQGIDLLGEEKNQVTWVKSPMGFGEVSQNDFSQFIGLGLFLVLFYLAGSQTFHSLSRYLNCAELVKTGLDQKKL